MIYPRPYRRLGLSRDILSFVGVCRDIGFVQTLATPKMVRWKERRLCTGFKGLGELDHPLEDPLRQGIEHG